MGFKRWRKRRGAAPGAISTCARRRRSSARAGATRPSCSSESSRAIAKIREGRPFVGPARRLLERALAEAGIAREAAYITNAVKHFKWVARGKRRLHQRPREGEIEACDPWLVAEIETVRPRIVVCFGSTAARAVFGRMARIKDYRGRFSRGAIAECVYVTIHPSAVLRLVDRAARHAEYARFVADLTNVRMRVAGGRH